MGELKACPFCGSGETRIDEKSHWTGRSAQIISVTVRHWCETQGSGLKPCLAVTGKTREEAIERWNTRTLPDQEMLQDAP